MERKLQEAPGELEIVRAFVNTAQLEYAQEELTTAAALARWLADHRLAAPSIRASRADLSRAQELREAIRGILLTHSDGSPAPAQAWTTVDHAAQRARLRLRFEPDGAAVLEPEAGGVDAALGRLVAIAQRAIAEGTWNRLKACRQPTCQWAFYDHTKNHSGSWCAMEPCGNRAKARAYRARRGRGSAAAAPRRG